jgi:hypothetical protein
VSSDPKTGRKAQKAVTTTIGVSGYLMESDVLLWDRATQSLWSQVDGRAIAGPRSGQTFTNVPLTDTTWPVWKKAHPKTKVLRGPKPASRYKVMYLGYHQSDRVMFPTSHKSDALANKAVVSGIRLGKAAPCWDHAALKKAAAARKGEAAKTPLVWTTRVAESSVTLTYDPAGDSLSAAVREGTDKTKAVEVVSVLRMYWFAWYTFHPSTTIEAPPAPAASDQPEGKQPPK